MAKLCHHCWRFLAVYRLRVSYVPAHVIDPFRIYNTHRCGLSDIAKLTRNFYITSQLSLNISLEATSCMLRFYLYKSITVHCEWEKAQANTLQVEDWQNIPNLFSHDFVSLNFFMSIHLWKNSKSTLKRRQVGNHHKLLFLRSELFCLSYWPFQASHTGGVRESSHLLLNIIWLSTNAQKDALQSQR